MKRKPVVIETVCNPSWYSKRQRQTFQILAALLESRRFLVFEEPENAPLQEDA